MSDKENIVSDVTESSAEEVSAVQSPAADVSEAADTAPIAVTDAETEEEPSGPESYIVSPDGIALTASAPRSRTSEKRCCCNSFFSEKKTFPR